MSKSLVPPLSATDFLIASKQSEIQSLEYFLNMGQLVVMVSDLIHALQKERGASNLYLGSRGQHYAEVLIDYTHQTDDQIFEFDQTLKQIQSEITEHAGNGRLLNRIAYALHALANLPQFRAQVQQQKIQTHAAVMVYSGIIAGLLSIVFETADAAVDPTIARVLVALYNLMQGKELTGQERAVGSAGFSSGQFSAEQRERLQYLIDGQERCFELFHEFTEPTSYALYLQYAQSPYRAEIDRLRGLALSDPPLTIDPRVGDQWFKLLTQHIDSLKIVELGLQGHLQRLCSQRVLDAKKTLTQHQALIDTLETHPEESFIVMLSSTQSQNPAALQDYTHPEGFGPKLGRSVLELVQNQAQSLQQMHDELTAARTALEEKKLQEKAKVLLMKHRKLTEDQAHKLLRQMAMDQGKRLTDIARHVVEMAQGQRK
ncbi:nitrate regulatory protein [Aquirhabdus parva]|uniref:ANTAR domain-containing protein n=1 Tax=Aquirhabdus parva TaxID=2283318 RepID=A0A345P3P4_9GAMM|nr:nitrate regulatory protein [Aquirhabdus parva]AXI01903.1 ANTAR domain-containing protein [Aquirhabdus parva]